MMTADGNVHLPGNGSSSTFTSPAPGIAVPGNPRASAPNLDPVAGQGLPNPQQAQDQVPGQPPPADAEHILPGQVFGPPKWDDTSATPGTLGGPMPVMPRVDGDAFQKMLASPEFGDVVKEYFPHTLAGFTGDMATEWDGDPFAYGPPNAPGRDDLSNAFKIETQPKTGHLGERKWFGVLTTNREDPYSAPVVQKPNDPHPGG